MAENNVIIRLEDVGFAFPNGRIVLEHINFELREGEKVALIGDNGSGKTTLLYILVGLLRPSQGAFWICDKPMEKEQDFHFARQQVGLLFQNSDDQLFSPTVLEDVAFGPLNQGKSPDEAREIARDILKKLNLEGFEDRVTHGLSGGEKKLVALATVFAMHPKVLLLDEPTTGLDKTSAEHITSILNNLDISCLIVSHEYDFLVRSTHEIYSMQNGQIVYKGPSSTLHSHFHNHPRGDLPHEHT